MKGMGLKALCSWDCRIFWAVEQAGLRNCAQSLGLKAWLQCALKGLALFNLTVPAVTIIDNLNKPY